MCSNRKFRRFMALLLTIVMVLGTVGTSVSASTDYHGGSTGETSVPTWDPDNPYTGSWFTSSGTGGDSARGVRYSLVKIKKSAIATEIDSFDDYYTIGSIDVLSSELYTFYYSKYSSVAKNWLTNTDLAYTEEGTYGGTTINYRRLNALDYEVGYKKEGLSFFTDTMSYGWSGSTASGNGRGIITIEQFKSAAEAIMKKYYGSDIGTHITDLESCYTNLITDFYKNTQDDALLKSVGSNGEGVDGEDGRYVYEHSELLNALVMVLSGSFIFDFDSDGSASLSWPNTWGFGASAESFDTWFNNNIMTVEDFIAEDDEYCYRILAEPLFSAYPVNASVTYLNTVRDACNLAVCQDSSTPTLANLGYTGLRGYIGKYINGYDTFAIHQTVNEFVDYDKDTYLATLNPEGTNRAEALGAAIKKWKEDNAGYVSAFYSLGSNEASYFQGLGSNGFAPVMQAIFGEKTDSNATNYGSYWTYTFVDYQRYFEGSPIEYTVAVMNDDLSGNYSENGYVTSYVNGEPNYSTIGAILSYTPMVDDVTVTVTWEDDDNRDGYRPDYVDVELYAHQYNSTSGEWENVSVGTKTIDTTSTNSASTKQSMSFAASSVTKTVSDGSFINTLTQSTGDGTITYSSSDTSVATVDATTGKVTIVGVGTTTISATAAATDDYRETTVSYKLTVTKNTATLTVNNGTSTMTVSEDVDPFTLTTSYNGDGTLEYTSTNTNVATVDANGTVIVVGTGTAKITVSADATDNYTAVSKTITLKVTEASASISFAESTIDATLDENDTSLSYPNVANELTYSGSGTVTYTSSDENVAVYSEAYDAYFLLGGGTTTITATDGEISATFVLNVTVIPVFSFANSEIEVVVSEGTTKNNLSYLGAGTVTYKSSDPNVATVASDGTVTLLSAGTVTITASVSGIAYSQDASDSYTLTVIDDDAQTTLTTANLLGDVDGDGDVDSDDSIMLGNYVAHMITELTNPNAADVNGDGSINTSDQTLIAQIVAGTADQTYYNVTDVTNGGTVTITVGDTLNILVDSLNTSTPTYKSSLTSRATISSSGVITGVKAGTVTVTVTIPASGNYSKETYTFTVVVEDVATSTSNELSVEITSSSGGETTVESGKTYYCDNGDDIELEITRLGSGNISVTLSDSTVAYTSGNGTAWYIYLTGTGTTKVTIDVASDGTYAASTFEFYVTTDASSLTSVSSAPTFATFLASKTGVTENAIVSLLNANSMSGIVTKKVTTGVLNEIETETVVNDLVVKSAETEDSVSILTSDSSDEPTIQLMDNTVVVYENFGVTTTDTWSVTFDDLPVYHDGEKITYTAVVTSDINKLIPLDDQGEYAYDDYETAVTGTDIVFDRLIDKKDVEILIEWDDNNNSDGTRPTTVLVNLYADGEQVEGTDYSVVLTGDSTADTWAYTFENVPVNAEGYVAQEIVYTIEVCEVEENSLYPYYVRSYLNSESTMTYDLSESNYPYAKLTHDDEFTEKTVTIVWDDDSNVDGTRPDSVDIQLRARVYDSTSGTTSDEYVLDYTFSGETGDTWSVTFDELLLYNDGKEITYYAVITSDVNAKIADDLNQYTVSDGKLNVKVSRVADVGTVTTTLQWVDDDDNDNVRPAQVQVQLYAGSTTYGDPVILYADTGWTYTWTNLPSNSNGSEISYSVKITGDTSELYSNYNSVSISPASTTTSGSDVLITLTHKALTETQTVTIDWDDASDQDGVRPDSVTVTLYGQLYNSTTGSYDTAVVMGTSVINGDTSVDTWTVDFDDMPVYSNGVEILYSAAITSDLNALISSDLNQYSTVNTGDLAITASRIVDTGSITTAVQWVDNDNIDSTRPTQVTLQLKVNGSNYGDAVVVTEADGWSYTWDNLPAHVSGSEGVEAIYSVTSSSVADYTISYNPSSTTTATNQTLYVTMTHETETADVKAVITWNDESNRDGVRPETITVSLYAYQYVAATGTWETILVDAQSYTGKVTSDTWTVTFADMPVYHDGEAIIYQAAITSDLNAELPSYSNVYTSIANNLDIQVYHTTNTGSLTTYIQWIDDDDTDSVRPEQVEVQLYSGSGTGTAVGDSVILNEANGWSYTWNELDICADGKEGSEIIYRVKIVDTPDEYAVTYSPSTTYITDNQDILITLSHDVDMQTQTIYVYWDDESDRDGVRPEEVTVTLYAYEYNSVTGQYDSVVKGIYTIDSFSTSKDTWYVTTEELPVYNDGVQIIYWATITSDLNAQISSDMNQYTIDSNELAITASRIHDTGTITTSIQWIDDDDADGYRPEQVRVGLYVGTSLVGDLVVLNEENNWSYQWDNLDLYTSGKEGDLIVYKVKVTDSSIDGYDWDYWPTETTIPDDQNLLITMTHEQEVEDQVITINWYDDSNRDGVRPDTVTVSLYAYQYDATTGTWETVFVDAQAYGGSASKDTWTLTFADMPVYHDGKAIIYQAAITSDLNAELPSYSNEYTSVANNLEINVYHTTNTGSLTTYIQWIDDNDTDSVRPEQVEVQLYSGSSVIDSVVLNAANGWSYTWTGLDVCTASKEGSEISYKVKVATTPDEYAVTYTPSSTYLTDNQDILITLSHDVEMQTQTIYVYWDDESNRDGVRPEEVTVTLYAYEYNSVTGEYESVVKGIYTIDNFSTSKDTWYITTEELPVYNDGEQIIYWATITSDLNAQISSDMNQYTIDSNELAITASRIHDTGSITTSIQWIDDNDADGYRPEQVRVGLYMGTTLVGDIVVLNEANNWSYQWDDLDIYASGKEGDLIEYKVKVTDTTIDGYPTSEWYYWPTETTIPDNQNLLITLTHEQDVEDQTVTINWYDDSNRDGIRPDEVTVSLYAYQYNAETGTWETVYIGAQTYGGKSSAATWTLTFDDMPVYHDGEEIIYKAEITSDMNAEIPSYSNGYTSNAKDLVIDVYHTTDTGSITTYIQWIDDDDEDGYRPEQVEVTLYYGNGTEAGTAILSADNNWSYTWNNLYINAESKEGTQLAYYVVATYPDEYAVVYTPRTTYIPDGYDLLITLTHDKDTLDRTGTIYWKDYSNQDGVRPDSVTVNLYGYQYNAALGTWEDVSYGSMEVSGDVTKDTWTYTYEDLPIYNDGYQIIYWATITSDLNALIPADQNKYTFVNNEMDITVSRITDTGSVSTSILWVDDGDNDNTRPESVLVQLYKDGTAYGDSVLLTADNGWSYEWTDLDVYVTNKEGVEVVYSVAVIDNLSADYSITYTPVNTTAISGDDIVITIAHETELTDKEVVIYWDDESDRDGQRPDSVTVTLYAYQYNATLGTWETVEVDKATWDDAQHVDTWRYTFEDVPVYHDGYEIIYKAEITSDMNANIPDWANGYTSVSNNLEIIATHVLDTGNISTSIQWIDEDDEDGYRPEQVYVQLYSRYTPASGNTTAVSPVIEAIGDPVLLNAENNWSYEWEDLYIFADGHGLTIAYDETNDIYVMTGNEGILLEYYVEVVDDSVDTDQYTILYTPSFTYVTENQNLQITCIHDTDVADRTVTIHWDDSSNRDGVRPTDVTVTVYGYQWNSATNTYDTEVLNLTYTFSENEADVTSDTWTHTFEDLPVYNDGQPIIYIAEITSNLNAQIDTDLHQYTSVSNEMDIVASRITDTGTITTSIQWIDDDDNDGERPEQVRVQLFADGVAYGKSVVLNEDNGWSYEWNDLDIHVANMEGVDIVYNVEVVADDVAALLATGPYTIKYLPQTTVVEDAQNLLITITDETDTDSYTATVYWNDDSNRDGLRPESLTLVLYKDGEPYIVDGNYVYGVIDATTGNTGDYNTWTYTFTGLEVMSDGTQAEYSAVLYDLDAVNSQIESWYNVANAYSVEYSALRIVMSHTNERGTITTSIQWIDDDNNDGERPEQVEVQLFADGVAYGDPVVLNEANNWSYEWNNLYVYNTDGEGTLTEYCVRVASDIGEYTDIYTPMFTYTTENQNLLITLTDVEDVLDRTVTIHWDDSSNRDAVRPETVTVTLIGYQWNSETNQWEDVVYGTADISDSVSTDVWTYTFESLPIYHDGQTIIYRAEVSSDLNAQIESPVHKYTNVTNEMDIVISRITDTGTITTSIQWLDDDNNDGERPEQVRVQLFADGVAYGTSVVLNEDNGWSYEWNDLDLHVAGQEGTDIVYRVEVVATDVAALAAAGPYSIEYMPVTTVIEDAQNLLIAITDETDLDSYTATVYWNDDSNRDGLRPESITLVLYKDGEPYLVDGNYVYGVIDATTGNTGDYNTWTYTFTDLEVMSDGTQAVYSAVLYDLDAINNLIASQYNVDNAYSVEYSALRIVMNHENERGTITTSIQWIDDDANDDQRPEQVYVQLYADGIAYGEPVTLNAANGWSYEWYDLYTYSADEHGALVEYSVEIVGSINPYTAIYTPTLTYTTENQNLLITLTDDPDVADRTVTIHWDDSSNRDGVRPETVTVTLIGYQWNDELGDWEDVVYGTADITDSVSIDVWTYTFESLPIYHDGEEIIYRAVVSSDLNAQIESPVHEYTNVTNEMDIVISRITDTGNITTSIQWIDDDNNDNERPEQVRVQLYADDVAIGDIVVLSEANDWSYEWTDLDLHVVDEEGVDIVYYVRVIDEDTANLAAVGPYDIDYTPEKTVIENNQNLLITITDETDTDSYTATVYWNDDSNRDGLRPESITLVLYKDGEPYLVDGNYVYGVIDATTGDTGDYNTWTYTFKDLEIMSDGTQAEYSAVLYDLDAINVLIESQYNVADAYSVEYSALRIVMNHINERGTITTSIQWIDDDANDSQRPEQVYVQLYADGVAYGEPVTLNAANDWSYEWYDLYTYSVDEHGAFVEYSVEIVGSVSPYTAIYTPTLTYTTENQNLLITLTDDPDVADRTVTIHWNDSSNRDVIRPETVTVTLIGYQWNSETSTWEDVVYGSADIDGDVTEDIWTYTFEDLLIYHDGEEIIYRAEITSDLNALISAELNQYTDVTNEMDIVVSRITDTGTITTSVQWVDDDNNDNERPEQIQVQLYADGVAYGQPVVLNDANNWSYEWNDLDIHVAGQEGVDIIYNVVVIEDDTKYLAEVGPYDIVYTPVQTVIEDAQNLLITITDETDLDSYTATVYWNDDSNRDGLRPESIILVLYKDGEPYLVDGNYVYGVISADTGNTGDYNTWTYTFTDLEIMSDGTQAEYSAVVYDIEAINNLIASQYNVDNAYSVNYSALQIIMNHENERGMITTSIQWIDDDANDDQRPEQVYVQLYADGIAYGEPVTLNAANGWSYEWYDLYTYSVDEHGALVEYSVEIVGSVSPYTAIYTPTLTYTTENQNLLITLTDDPDVADRTVTIHWDDSSNRDDVRPETVTVTLIGYQWNDELGDWEDVVYGTADITDSVSVDVWTYTFKSLPIYHDGEEIIYRAVVSSDLNAQIESPVHEYTNVTNEMDIVISRITDTGNITTSIQWIDDDNNDNERPEQVRVQLYADDVAIGDIVVLSEANGWSYEWTDLDLHVVDEEGVDIVYYVRVIDDDTDYLLEVGPYDIDYTPEKTVIENNQNLLITITDETDLDSYTATVYWNDDSNRDGLRPESITLVLYKDGEPYLVDGNYVYGVIDATTGNTGDYNTWTYTFKDLEIMSDGTQAEYSAVLYDLDAINALIESQYNVADAYSVEYSALRIVMNHINERGTITTSIQWIDDDANDNQRPEQVEVQLYADGEPYGEPVVLNAANNWSYAWYDLYVNSVDEEGNRTEYKVKVVSELGEYTDVYTPTFTYITENQNLLITLTDDPDVADRTVTIHWDDSSNRDGVRPETVTVTLIGYQWNSETSTWEDVVYGTADITDSVSVDVWTYTFKSLPIYHDGEEIIYRAVVSSDLNAQIESPVHEYTNVTNEMDIVISRITDTGNITTSIQWIDDDNNDNERPEQVRVQLYADDVAIGDIVVLSEANGWSYEWTDLDLHVVDEEGVDIVYYL